VKEGSVALMQQNDPLSDLDWLQQSPSALGNAVNRLLLSKAYTFFYMIMIVFNVILVIWIMVNSTILKASRNQNLFITIEFFLNTSLIFEVVLKIIGQKKNYFLSYSNCFDFVIMVLSWFALILYLVLPNEIIGVEGASSNTLLVLRYSVQFLRLVLMLKNQKQLMQTSQSRVDFSLAQMEDHAPEQKNNEINL